MPHPNFVPVSASSSRKYQSSGIDGSPSKERSLPFTFSFAIEFLRSGEFRKMMELLIFKVPGAGEKIWPAPEQR
jgi:hypothetical protein